MKTQSFKTNQNTNDDRQKIHQNIVVIKICLEENDIVDDIYSIETSRI